LPKHVRTIIKSNIAKHSERRDNGEAQTIGIGLRKKRHKDNDDNKDSTLIDLANRREIDDVVNSGNTLTEKA
jgi:hypothetical protein